jgi:tRNA (guanosine-2'-O-)-methyltransferase
MSSIEQPVEETADFTSPTRADKIDKTLERRQPTLAIVLENIHDPHNFNAILRSADATGVIRVIMLYYIEKSPRLAHTTSSGAYKWVDIEKYDSVTSCFKKLKEDGFRILATKLDAEAKPLYAHDLTQPTAIVLGNEHRGISHEAQTLADELLYIPMMGMSESVNVSVASAVCLFEAMRQRMEKGMYDTPQLSPEALRSKKLEWRLK